MVRLTQGETRAAAEAIDEAVRIFRKLAEERPDAFLAGMAECLINLGTVLGELNLHQRALQYTREAVDTVQKLDARYAEPFQPALANAWNNLAMRWAVFGALEQSLQAASKAVH